MRPRRANGDSGGAGADRGRGRIEMAPAAAVDITTDRLGEVLSQRRKALGLKLEDVAEDIKIRPDYLRALEDESLEDLPTPEYARLFLKAYAERLGIDPSEIYALWDLCAPPPKSKPIPQLTSPNQKLAALPTGPRAGVPLAWIIGAGVIVIVIVLYLLYGSGDGVSTDEGAVPTESQAEFAVQATQAPPVEMPQAPPIIEPLSLSLRFAEDTWVMLVADDEIVTQGIRRQGDSASAIAKDRFMLKLGHTDGVSAVFNGRAITPVVEWASPNPGVVITAESTYVWHDTAAVMPAQSERAESDTTGAPY